MVKRLFSLLPVLTVTIALAFFDLPWCGNSIFFFGEPKHPDLQ